MTTVDFFIDRIKALEDENRKLRAEQAVCNNALYVMAKNSDVIVTKYGIFLRIEINDNDNRYDNDLECACSAMGVDELLYKARAEYEELQEQQK